MTEQSHNVKGKLLGDIEREWGALNASLENLDETQMTEIRDPQGWSVKDHLIHMAFWERGVCFFLQGKPRHQGMEIDEELLKHGDFDQINAVIQQAQKDMSLAEVKALIHYCHRQLLHQVQGLSEADLLKPYRRYTPEESGEGDGPPTYNMIYDNTAGHFAEHREWIEALVKDRL
jgi:hypothetical protein